MAIDSTNSNSNSLLAQRFYANIQQFTDSKYWKAKLVFYALCLSCIFQFPNIKIPHWYYYRHNATLVDYFDVFSRQVAAPFNMHLFEGLNANGHASKMVFRITIPLLMHILHLPPIYVFVIQFIFGIITYFVIINLINHITNDPVATTLLTLGLSCTYFGCAFINDFRPYLDSFSYGILILLFITSNNTFIILLAIAGSFNDERFLLALPIVMLWYFCREQAPAIRANWNTILRSALKNHNILAIGAGIFCYLCIRLFLAKHYHMSTQTTAIGLDALAFTTKHGFLMVGLISGMESFGIILFIAILVLKSHKSNNILLLLLASIIPATIAALSVADITRSLSYIMPVFLLSLYLLNPYMSKNSLRHLSAFVMIGALLIPTISITGNLDVAYSILDIALDNLLAPLGFHVTSWKL